MGFASRVSLLTHGRRVAVAGALLLATLLGGLVVAQSAGAEGDRSEISLSPTKSRLVLEPGVSASEKFTVLNIGESEFTFRVYVSPYQVTNEQYDATFSQETARTQITRWVSVPDEEYTLQPGEKKEIEYTVNVPTDVPAGGQYAVIFAETTDDEGAGGSIIAKKRVGMLTFGSVAGETRESGAVASRTLKGWQHEVPLSSEWRIENTGNTDFAATTTLTVKNIFGRKLYESPKVEGAVLPETTRAITMSWDNSRWGLYHATTTAEFLGSSHEESRLVLVMPPLVLIGLAAVVLLVVAGTIIYAKKTHKTQSTKRKTPKA